MLATAWNGSGKEAKFAEFAPAAPIWAGRAKQGRVPALWDGNAAARIADILERDLSQNGTDDSSKAGAGA